MTASDTLTRLVDCDAIFSSLATHAFPLTGYQRRRIVELRRQGCRLWRIAREVGVPERQVAEVLVANGVALFAQFERPAQKERR